MCICIYEYTNTCTYTDCKLKFCLLFIFVRALHTWKIKCNSRNATVQNIIKQTCATSLLPAETRENEHAYTSIYYTVYSCCYTTRPENIAQQNKTAYCFESLSPSANRLQKRRSYTWNIITRVATSNSRIMFKHVCLSLCNDVAT